MPERADFTDQFRARSPAAYAFLRLMRRAIARMWRQTVVVVAVLVSLGGLIASGFVVSSDRWRYGVWLGAAFIVMAFGVLQVALYAQHTAQRHSAAARRLQDLEKRITSDAMRASGRLTEVEDTAKAMEGDVARIVERVQPLEDTAKAMEGDVARIVERVQPLEDTAKAMEESLIATQLVMDTLVGTSELERERSARSLTVAHAVDPGLPLRRVLLQMATPRSGSTRLYDTLRAHPSVRVASTMEVWHALELKGRRYPGAFSDVPGSWTPIEVQPEVGATIANVKPIDLPAPPLERRWLLEKAHPEFIDFDTVRLVRNIETLRSNDVEVSLIIGIRRPLETMWSMAEYKKRQPAWHRNVDFIDIPEWILRSLQVLRELQEEFGGFVVDFDDFPKGESFRSIGKDLGEGWSRADVTAWLSYAKTLGAKSKRIQKEGAGFIGERDRNRNPSGPEGMWANFVGTVSAADEVYEEILGNRT